MRAIDADALTESIGCADAVKYGNRDRAQQDTSYSTMMLYEIKDEIDAQPTIGGWISVKDRLPEKDGDYLARLRHGGMKVMGFTHDLRKVDDYQFKRKKPGWYEYDSEWGFCERNDITHYMPLPEPPKEED